MHFKMLSAIRFNLEESKFLSSGNGLMVEIGALNGPAMPLTENGKAADLDSHLIT